MKQRLCWYVVVEALLGFSEIQVPTRLNQKPKIKTLKNIKQRKEVEDAKK